MYGYGKLVALFVVCVALAGCRNKGWESFVSATETNPVGAAPVPGDPYGFGSVAVANGGLKYKTNYGAGANPTSTAAVNPTIDQPEKGTGQMPGEYPDDTSYGQSKGPALQPQPGDQPGPGDIAHG
jgi:hypothetical protein